MQKCFYLKLCKIKLHSLKYQLGIAFDNRQPNFFNCAQILHVSRNRKAIDEI